MVSYKVECDYGTGAFSFLGDVTYAATGTHTISTPASSAVLTPNTNYNFRVSALNGVGYGPYGTLTVLSCNYPQSMNSPTL